MFIVSVHLANYEEPHVERLCPIEAEAILEENIRRHQSLRQSDFLLNHGTEDAKPVRQHELLSFHHRQYHTRILASILH